MRAVLTVSFIIIAIASLSVPAVQRRMFYGNEGSFQSIVEGRFNTAGRDVLFPYLIAECSPAQPRGVGAGSSNVLTEQVTGGQLSSAHSDYLRWYCDAGLVGSIPYWFFFVAAGFGAYRIRDSSGPAQVSAYLLVTALLIFSVTTNPAANLRWFMLPLVAIIGIAHADREEMSAELPR